MYKKIFLGYVFLFMVSLPAHVFGMLKKVPQKEVEESKTIWAESQSKGFFEWRGMGSTKSFVFKTKTSNVLLLAVEFVDSTTAIYKIDPKNATEPIIQITGYLKEKTFPPIDKHYEYAKKDFYGKWTIYTSHKTKDNKYIVNEVTSLENDQNSLKQELRTKHNFPIMHLCKFKIKVEKKEGFSDPDYDITYNYLVSGSFYPSIKFCDVSSYEEQSSLQLRNRFLIGSTDNDLIYARKNNYRYTRFTQYFDASLDKNYVSSLYKSEYPFKEDNETRQDSFFGENNIKKNIYINIPYYPLSTSYGTNIFIFDPLNNEQLYPIRDYAFIPKKILTRTSKIENPNFNTIKSFLNSNDAWECFKELFIYKDFLQFKKDDPKQTVQAYVRAMITQIVNTCIERWDLKEHAIDILLDQYLQSSKADNIDLMTAEFNKETFKHLQKFNQTNTLQLWLNNNQNNTKFDQKFESCSFYNTIAENNNIKHIYLSKDYLTMHTNKQIWECLIQNNTIVNIKHYNIPTDEFIENVFSIGSVLYYVTKKGLYKIDLTEQLSKESVMDIQ